jgi:NTP pyrophosphatase (non-canonical NTP hydrolase)
LKIQKKEQDGKKSNEVDKMDFETYQKTSRKTAIYPDKDSNFTYPALGLAGETGEVIEKIKKLVRDKSSVIDDEFSEEVKKEMGDVLWYLAQLATELKISLNEVAEENIEKLMSRMERGKLHGKGDNR